MFSPAAMAKERGAKRALSLVTKDAFRSIAQRLSIDSTINPETATISSIIAHVRRGSVQAMHSVQHGRADLIEAKAMKSAVIVGKFLRDSPFPNRSRIGAVMSRSGVLKEIRGDLQFEDGDQVVVLSDSRDTRSIEALFRVGISYFSRPAEAKWCLRKWRGEPFRFCRVWSWRRESAMLLAAAYAALADEPSAAVAFGSWAAVTLAGGGSLLLRVPRFLA